MTSVTELYHEPELRDKVTYTWTNKLPLDEMLLLADVAVAQDDPIGYLDNLIETDFTQYSEIKKVITELPAEVIHANYGTEMLAWAAANATFTDTSDRLYKGLEEYAGIDTVLFEKGRLWEWQKHYSTKGKDIFGQYRLMEYVTRGGLDQVDLESILIGSALPGVELSPKRLKDYGLMPLVSQESFARPDGPAQDWYYLQDGSDIYWGIWLDAPTGFALTYKGKPNAVVGLAKSSPSELMAYQLQGVYAKRIDLARKHEKDNVIGRIGARGLAPIDWQRVMIGVTQQLAEAQGIPVLGLQAGKNNKWTKIIDQGETEPHISEEAAEKAYDLTAKRLGFERGAQDNWFKPVA